jgi:hypothetical protein
MERNAVDAAEEKLTHAAFLLWTDLCVPARKGCRETSENMPDAVRAKARGTGRSCGSTPRSAATDVAVTKKQIPSAMSRKDCVRDGSGKFTLILRWSNYAANEGRCAMHCFYSCNSKWL